MKVTATSDDRLVLEDRPLFLWVMLYGMGGGALIAAATGQVQGLGVTLLVAGLGLSMLWVAWRLLPFQRFVFDRPKATFTHQIRRTTGGEVWERPLSEIRRAADEGNWSEGTRMERVTLLTTDGRYPLESGFSGTPRTDVIRAINDWLGVSADS